MKLNSGNFIGIFDSGIGGISVLNQCIRLMPNENYVFFADSSNFPYGTKPKAQIAQIGLDIIGHFDKLGSKEVIIACNTMSTSDMPLFVSTYPNLKILGTYPDFTKLLTPGAILKENDYIYDKENGLQIKKSKLKLLIIATTATCKSTFLTQLVNDFKNYIDIYVEPTDFIVKAVENDKLDTFEFKNHLEFFFKEYKDINYLLLGCTHFTFASDEIKKIVNDDVIMFSGGDIVAKYAFEYTSQNDMTSNIVNPTITIIDSQINDRRIKLYNKLIRTNSHKIVFEKSFDSLS